MCVTEIEDFHLISRKAARFCIIFFQYLFKLFAIVLEPLKLTTISVLNEEEGREKHVHRDRHERLITTNSST